MSKAVGLPSEVASAIPAFRAHLRELADSSAFKGSRRSQQFLEHVVEKALAGESEELKERSLGVELFGRDPSYDTGEDAIVRVTASDVRRRLQQYYSVTNSRLRIELQAGSYTPHFHCVPDTEMAEPVPARPWRLSPWLQRSGLAVLLIGAAVVSATWLWRRNQSIESLAPIRVLPWSVLLQGSRQLQIVLADPDISATQELTGTPITLSDYANRRYVKNPETLPAEKQAALRLLLGVNVAAVDAGIVASIARLAAVSPVRLKINTARSLQLSAFQTDDGFVILGSPRSNPWISLFEDLLDFEFVRDPQLDQEIILNKRPRPGELARYAPTARGWGTGHSFAIIALVANPNQTGKVLLLAGTNAEGTEAAGQFLANSAEFAGTLRAHGIEPSGPPCQFQILLQVSTMAGSPSRLQVVACHRLSGVTVPAGRTAR